MKPRKERTVMAQRIEPPDSLDDFPTPPWAARALFELVLEDPAQLSSMTCLEPACGAGHMVKVLREYFRDVRYSDVYDFGFGTVSDFLTTTYERENIDWIITNPPFRLAEEFILRSLAVAKEGVAVLGRAGLLETVGRYQRIYREFPPTFVAQFVER